MDDRNALLAAILAAPMDDLPRLVYADAIEETGDPVLTARAEFIRVQVRAASLADQMKHPTMRNPTPSHPVTQWCDCERCRCERRACELFDRWGPLWFADDVANDLVDWASVSSEVRVETLRVNDYRRGFPWRVRATIPESEIDRVPTCIAGLYSVAPLEGVNVSVLRPRAYGPATEVMRVTVSVRFQSLPATGEPEVWKIVACRYTGSDTSRWNESENTVLQISTPHTIPLAVSRAVRVVMAGQGQQLETLTTRISMRDFRVIVEDRHR